MWDAGHHSDLNTNVVARTSVKEKRAVERPPM